MACWLNAEEYRPSFNLAPQNRAAVVRRINAHENRLGIDCMKWGLVPHWTEAPPTHGSLLNTINARDDKVVEPRGLWSTVKGKRRCIILCEGFFEWLNKGKDKIPHFTKRTGADEPLMCLAGLWDSVTYKGTSEELHTFTIITTSSNKYLSFRRVWHVASRSHAGHLGGPRKHRDVARHLEWTMVGQSCAVAETLRPR